MAVAQLRKSLTLAILDREVPVEVDFRLIETLERAFGQSADMLIPLLMRAEGVQRNRLADVMVEVLSRRADNEWKLAEIREAVVTAPAEVFYLWVAQFSAALLFILRHMKPEDFDKAQAELAAGSKKKTTETAQSRLDS